MSYDFNAIENKWENVWEKEQTYKTDCYDFSSYGLKHRLPYSLRHVRHEVRQLKDKGTYLGHRTSV